MDHDLVAVVWRRRWIIIAVFVVVVAGTAAVSQVLPKVYSTTSTLLISLDEDRQTFDTVQAGQALARSYADIIDSPVMAERVADYLARPQDAKEIDDAMSFEAVSETQLLKISAESRSRLEAQSLANAYASVFTDYAQRRLAETTRADIAVAVDAPEANEVVRPRPTLYVFVAVILGLPLAIAFGVLVDRVSAARRAAVPVVERRDEPGDDEEGPDDHRRPEGRDRQPLYEEPGERGEQAELEAERLRV